MTASERTFAIPELHEAILLNANPKDLLVSAQRVSKSWQTLIETSSPLQRKLFFKQRQVGDQNAIPVKNPFLEQVFGPSFEFRVCAFSWDHFHYSTREWALRHGYRLVCIHVEQLRERRKIKKGESWQKMFITDIPSKYLVNTEYGGTLYSVKDNVSVTMSTLMRKYCIADDWRLLEYAD